MDWGGEPPRPLLPQPQRTIACPLASLAFLIIRGCLCGEISHTSPSIDNRNFHSFNTKLLVVTTFQCDKPCPLSYYIYHYVLVHVPETYHSLFLHIVALLLLSTNLIDLYNRDNFNQKFQPIHAENIPFQTIVLIFPFSFFLFCIDSLPKAQESMRW